MNKGFIEMPSTTKVAEKVKNQRNLTYSFFMSRYMEFLETVKDNECVYFVHSFYATDCEDAVIATTEYGAELTAAVARGNVMGCQFHPEKSGDVGLAILKTFCEGSW